MGRKGKPGKDAISIEPAQWAKIGEVEAVELINERNVRQPTYAADDYAGDQAALRRLVEEVSPDTLLVGPGSTGETGFKLFANPPEIMSTARLLGGTPTPEFDVFSYHFYGAVSQRWKSLGERPGQQAGDHHLGGRVS